MIVRAKPSHDGAVPSANSVSAINLLRLAKLTDDSSLSEKTETIFRLFLDEAEQAPFGFPQMFCALDFYFGDVKEIVVIGDRASSETEDALNIIYNSYIPNKVLVFCDPSKAPEGIEKVVPLLEGRIKPDDKIQIYICENYVCKSPISDANALKESL